MPGRSGDGRNRRIPDGPLYVGAVKERGEDERRRSARFTCGGDAKISRLPSDGIFLPGKILDLSLGGCCVDTAVPIHFGVRAEILVRVNAAAFRAVGEVKAIRGSSAAGIEFVQISAGGKDMLAELVEQLTRLRAVMKKLKLARRELDAESVRRQLEDGRLRAMKLSERLGLMGTILQREEHLEEEHSAEETSASAGQDRVEEAEPLLVAVELFG